jgi:hypothetical protein
MAKRSAVEKAKTGTRSKVTVSRGQYRPNRHRLNTRARIKYEIVSLRRLFEHRFVIWRHL